METTNKQSTSEYKVREAVRTPVLSFVLGYGAMLPLAAGAAAAWSIAEARPYLVQLTIAWGAAILIFLSGVRRGLSFRTAGGATRMQIVTMLGLFVLGFAALLSPSPLFAVVLLLVGYASLAIGDPLAAQTGEAPPFFARLRPGQMLFAMLALAALAVLMFR